MTTLFTTHRWALSILFLTAMSLRGADPADPSIKLREQLRGVMLQLRSAQTETANALATQAAAEAKNKELADSVSALEKRVGSMVKQSYTDKAASDQTIASLTNKLEEREKRLTAFTEALEKWKIGYEKAAEIARTKEDERAKLAAEIVVHKRTITDRESKNIALFNTSNEVLDRFESFALGNALSAREPFIGNSRVKIENLVQGYKDKVLDNRIAAEKP